MDSVTQGFCDAVLTLSPSSCMAEAVARCTEMWPKPTLQVVDIQRYPRPSHTPATPSVRRFYLAASDGRALVWLVVPPHTALEERIASYELDVGCCLTLLDYVLAQAANGRLVVVPRRVTFSTHPLSLLGAPAVDTALFALSSAALTQRVGRQGVASDANVAAAVVPEAREVVLCDLLHHPELALNSWSITLRVIWRGRERQVMYRRGPYVTAGGASRQVVRCIVVDRHGDAIPCTFGGKACTAVAFAEGDCLHIVNGGVSWGAGELGVIAQLRVSETTSVCLLSGVEADALPRHPTRLVGATAAALLPIQHILQHSVIDDNVSLLGRVRVAQPEAHVQTKRGRVLRRTVVLEDPASPHAVIELTLWDEIAEALSPREGELWCVLDCVVREFMHRKTLSNRGVTAAFRMVATQDEQEGDRALQSVSRDA